MSPFVLFGSMQLAESESILAHLDFSVTTLKGTGALGSLTFVQCTMMIASTEVQVSILVQ